MTAKKTTANNNYTAAKITVLEGLEPVRKRPGMYIGNTAAEGLHHLIWEVVDNSFDEAIGGYCNEILVKILPDNIIEVTDNGRGIPVDIHPQTKVSALETVMTKLHAGGKFGEGGYKVSGGLHGVGVSVVNALSLWTKAEVRRDGKIWIQEYKRGKPVQKTKALGKISLVKKINKLDLESQAQNFETGTKITFQPDHEIFSVLDFNFEKIINHLRQQAYLTKQVKVIIIDQRQEKAKKQYVFYFEGGVASYIKYLNKNTPPIHETVFYTEKNVNDINVEIALRYVQEYTENILAFANNIYNPEGGMHLAGFKTALTRTLNSYARKKNLLKEKDENLSSDDVREGLTGIISVKLKDPQFEGQTKAKLGNVEVKAVVEQVLSEQLMIFLEEHPKDAESIFHKASLAAQARKAARTARESVLRKGALEGMTLPGKLADCSSRDAKACELYIVEGNSAGGTAKQGRNREFQAILPLRGKILNVEKSRIDKILANNEIKSLIIAMGTNVGEQFDLDKLRYDRIIIMTDADVDGAHIRTLLLTLFFRHFPALINQGHIYIAQPPLYRTQIGKEIRWHYSDDSLQEYLQSKKVKDADLGEVIAEAEEGQEIPLAKTTKGKIGIQRYKGLGEMNPEQLWETTMNPENRILKRVTVQDAQAADQTFDILMGSEVEPRKHFIQTHAQNVKNLDI